MDADTRDGVCTSFGTVTVAVAFVSVAPSVVLAVAVALVLVGCSWALFKNMSNFSMSNVTLLTIVANCTCVASN